MRIAAVALLLLLASDKPAWKWTDEERVAARLDPQHLKERREAHSVEVEIPLDRLSPYMINGARNPELFLPGEVMAMLLSSFGDDGVLRESDRGHLQESIESFGWNADDFWSDLRLAATDYLHRTQQDDPSKKRTPEQSRALCAARIRALHTMREKYERFDGFLYRVIASRSVTGSEREENAEWLLWLNGGCQ